MKKMTYQEATEYLFGRRAMGMKLGLDNIKNLLERLNHPEKKFPSIHIAGTNGKGSTAAIIESILREAGYKTGLYTSPHIIDMRERMKINSKSITEKAVLGYTRYLIPNIEAAHASFFETLTAMAFLYFSEQDVDIAILETGLGGRLDATNVVNPLLTVITEIGLEHTKILGKCLESIVREKAGILKTGIPCIAGIRSLKVRRFLSDYTANKNIPITFTHDSVRLRRVRLTERGSWFDAYTGQTTYKDLYLNLLGLHQVENTAIALLIVEELKNQGWEISEKAVRKGLEKISWRARLELLRENPKLLLDSAHNPLGIQMLTNAIKHLFNYNNLILVFGVLRDKNYQSMVKHIVPLADRVVFTRPLSDRALEPDILLRLPFINHKKTETIPEIEKAWDKAVSFAKKDDMVCGCGSIYFVGEVLRLWENQKR